MMKINVATHTNVAGLPFHAKFVQTIPNSTMHAIHEVPYIVTLSSLDVNKGVMSQLHNVMITQSILQQYESL
jgi:hypothetical protein